MNFPQYPSTSFYAVSSEEFDEDAEFRKLIGRNGETDLSTLFFELARDRAENLDFQPMREWIQSRISELRGPLLKSHSGIERLENIVHHLTVNHKLYGHPCYEEEACSNDIDCLIQKQCGSPIALAVLFQAIAGPLGVDTEIVAVSPRELLRFESVEKTVFLDLYDSGSINDFSTTAKWLQDKNGMSANDAETELEQHAVSPRKLVLRTLYHMKRSLKSNENYERLWKVQMRLAALKPASYEERRDLGLTALKANRPGKAVCILQNCLRSCPANESQMLSQSLEEAKQQVSQWN